MPEEEKKDEQQDDGNFIGGFLSWIGAGAQGGMDYLANDKSPFGKILNLALTNEMRKYSQPQTQPTGYQGKVDMDLERVRERVPTAPMPTAGRNVGIMSGENNMAGDMYQKGQERRPGSNAQRYFTDTIYAKRPETTVPTVAEAEATAATQVAELAKKNNPNYVPPEPPAMAMGGRVPKYAHGGIAGAHKGYYLGGKTDGMADDVPARIDGNQEARLSDGEFVIPADVVSHLGNGNSDAGADQLHSMMSGVRQARTGNSEQGKQINPQQFMPKMAQGGLAQYAGGGSVYKNKPVKTNFEVGEEVVGSQDQIPADSTGAGGTGGTGAGATDTLNKTGTESSLSNWAGDYVTEGILEPAAALAKDGYEAFDGPLTAGTSTLQNQAFTGILDLNNPLSGQSVTKEMGTFTPDQATLDPYMNPYEQNVIDRTSADMRRQSGIDALQDRTAMTSAGAFGGSRDALMRAERSNNLSRGIADMSAEQRSAGFTQAMDRGIAAQKDTNQYGFDVLGAQAKAGADLRGIDQDRIAAEYAQFREQREFPYKQVQYMQSLLQGLPLAAQTTTYSEPSPYDKLVQGEAAVQTVEDYLMSGSGGSGEYEADEAELDQISSEV